MPFAHFALHGAIRSQSAAPRHGVTAHRRAGPFPWGGLQARCANCEDVRSPRASPTPSPRTPDRTANTAGTIDHGRLPLAVAEEIAVLPIRSECGPAIVPNIVHNSG